VRTPERKPSRARRHLIMLNGGVLIAIGGSPVSSVQQFETKAA
jgi:hypothetical protein